MTEYERSNKAGHDLLTEPQRAEAKAAERERIIAAGKAAFRTAYEYWLGSLPVLDDNSLFESAAVTANKLCRESKNNPLTMELLMAVYDWLDRMRKEKIKG